MKKLLISILSVVLLISSAPLGKVSASTNDEQLVQELAESLQFIYEEATIVDRFGNIIGLDTKKIAKKYGDSIDPTLLAEINQLNSFQSTSDQVSPMTAKVDACINKQIKANYGWMLGGSAISIVWGYLKAGEYTLAAKYLVKIGIKGTVPGIATNLVAYFFYCLYTEEGWI